MPSLLQLLTTYLPDAVIIVAGIVLTAVAARRGPVAAGLAIAGCVCWLTEEVIAWRTIDSASMVIVVVQDAVFALGMVLLLAAAIVGVRRRRSPVER
jgi:hypothetical protein